MERGDFYASTGVELADYVVSNRAITVTIAALSRSRYRVQFVGKGGRVLRDAAVTPTFPTLADGARLNPQAEPVTYELKGDEGYVRAKVTDSNGYMAWTQPFMVTARPAR